MERLKLFIQNRKGQNVAVLVDETKEQKGLAFVVHGLGGRKEEVHIERIAKTFLKNGFTVLRFDATNSSGESDGLYEDATITNYFEDLEGVISWSKTQHWYQEPFYLSGHSLGGCTTLLYTEKYPERVKGLISVSPTVSGQLSEEAKKEENVEEYQNWEKTGWLTQKSFSNPDKIKKLKWSHMLDRFKYDTLKEVSKLTMPVLCIVGELDVNTPPKHVRMLFDAISHKQKTFKLIEGAPHVFRDKKHLAIIEETINSWLQQHA